MQSFGKLGNVCKWQAINAKYFQKIKKFIANVFGNRIFFQHVTQVANKGFNAIKFITKNAQRASAHSRLNNAIERSLNRSVQRRLEIGLDIV